MDKKTMSDLSLFDRILLKFWPERGYSWKYVVWSFNRVSVQGVKSLGGHFACLCRGFEFYEVKKKLLLFFKKKMEILLHF